MAKQNKGRKLGRCIKKGHCKVYRNENRREKSHIRRIAKHLARYDANKRDNVARKALESYQVKAGVFPGGRRGEH